MTKEGLPWEYWRWQLVQETGWTLEYIDALPATEVMEYMAIREGKAHAQNSILR